VAPQPSFHRRKRCCNVACRVYVPVTAVSNLQSKIGLTLWQVSPDITQSVARPAPFVPHAQVHCGTGSLHREKLVLVFV
jgi:hypothetical protein